MVSRHMSVVTGNRGRRRIMAWAAAVVVLVPLLTLAYASLTPGSYVATARVRMITGGPDPLIQSQPVNPAQLSTYASDLRSLAVAEGAVERLPVPPPNKPALLHSSTEALKHLTVSTVPSSGEIVITVTEPRSPSAERLANGFAASFLQLLGAQAVNITNETVRRVAQQLAALPHGAHRRAARQAGLAAINGTLAPLIAQRQVQVVAAATVSTHPILLAATATAIALLVALIGLAAAGAWSPRAST